MAVTAAEFRFELTDESSLSDARRALGSWIQGDGPDTEVVSEILMAAGELCANALRAARSQTTLRAQMVGGSLLVHVEDDGEGMDELPPIDAPPPPTAESGRGLYVVRHLVDVLWIRPRANGGTTASFGRRLVP